MVDNKAKTGLINILVPSSFAGRSGNLTTGWYTAEATETYQFVLTQDWKQFTAELILLVGFENQPYEPFYELHRSSYLDGVIGWEACSRITHAFKQHHDDAKSWTPKRQHNPGFIQMYESVMALFENASSDGAVVFGEMSDYR
ncbi:hypothetical protein [Rhizobium sp. L245/93]|uniref:hypothetical protein n=1 Tax=Rhizobium sp. L245/93 TaxID=2819998 RepID=UPI001ADB3542|nr:hypothetical protein [Rhizobium sp. L245/93]MBO9172243.1 hypothetical protein [Rhizobium sp. L245/93]